MQDHLIFVLIDMSSFNSHQAARSVFVFMKIVRGIVSLMNLNLNDKLLLILAPKI